MTSVRRLRGADAAAYQALRLEGLRESPDAFGRTLAEEADRSLAGVAAMLDRHAVFGAPRGADLVGIAGLVFNDSARRAHKATLFGMYVCAGARGHGVAAALIDAIVAEARGRVEEVQLTVGAANIAARQLYERAGFRAYGFERRALQLDGVFSDEMLMALPTGGGEQSPPAATRFGKPRKRSITIAGHETSIALEPVFWAALEAAAARDGLPLNALIARIDAERIGAADPPNLASALRCWLFDRS